jgi:ankyrin repeat protein
MGNGASIEPYEGNELDVPVSSRVVEKQGFAGENGTTTGSINTSKNNFVDDSNHLKKTVTIEDDKDDSMTDILFQFIPYYGQGDPTNDSTVRAALSSLSVEDIDTKDAYGNTLLLFACQYRCEDLVRIMLNKGADPNALNSSGACSLHFACYGETTSMAIAKGLLQNGANPEVAETSYGCTPLHYAGSSGNVELCKLLLTHGAVINTVDYYNYTCVDYARQANMADAAVYLQQKLDQHHMQYQYRSGGYGFSPPQQRMGMNNNMGDNDWSSHMDPSSGHMYYVNNITGETLWEHDWRMRMQQQQQQQTPQPNGHYHGMNGIQGHAEETTSNKDKSSGTNKKKAVINVQAKKDAWLSSSAMKTRLIAFLGKHDPVRLPEIDNIMKEYKGREQDMVKELCAKYNVNEEAEIAAFKSKNTETKEDPSLEDSSLNGTMTKTASSFSLLGTMKSMMGGGSNDGGPGMDSLQLQALINEERAKVEVKLNEERDNFKIQISEKDGLLSKAFSDLELAKREADRLKVYGFVYLLQIVN